MISLKTRYVHRGLCAFCVHSFWSQRKNEIIVTTVFFK
jgi:hypothetical protein